MQRTAVESHIPQSQAGREPQAWTSKTFRALRHRNFRLFWIGQLISLSGTWMQQVAQQWLVYRITDSATLLGVVAAASSLPVLFFSLWAGVLVDRVPKRTLIIGTQLVAMTLAFTLAALVWFDLIQFWHIVVLATLLGTVTAVDMPARQAFVPEMVGRNKDDLSNAIALNASVFNAARVVGPAVAGLLVAAIGEAAAFGLNGATYVAVIAGLLMMRLPPHESSSSGRTPLLDIKDGISYVLRDPLKRVLVGALMVHTIFGTLHITLMPVFAREVFVVEGLRGLQNGETRLGLLMAAFGLGALAGALGIAALGDRTRAGMRISVGLFVYPVAFILFSLAPSFWAALPLLTIGGWSMITLLATTNMLLQSTTPDALRGRVMSLYTLVLVGFMPFGHLLAGFLADFFNSAPMAVRVAQVVVLATAFVVWFRAPQVRQAE
jgi:MFS family permease